MSDKTYIVTGSNNGIGFETTKALAAQKYQVVMICRSQERGEKARQNIARIVRKRPGNHVGKYNSLCPISVALIICK